MTIGLFNPAYQLFPVQQPAADGDSIFIAAKDRSGKLTACTNRRALAIALTGSNRGDESIPNDELEYLGSDTNDPVTAGQLSQIRTNGGIRLLRPLTQGIMPSQLTSSLLTPYINRPWIATGAGGEAVYTATQWTELWQLFLDTPREKLTATQKDILDNRVQPAASKALKEAFEEEILRKARYAPVPDPSTRHAEMQKQAAINAQIDLILETAGTSNRGRAIAAIRLAEMHLPYQEIPRFLYTEFHLPKQDQAT